MKPAPFLYKRLSVTAMHKVTGVAPVGWFGETGGKVQRQPGLIRRIGDELGRLFKGYFQ